MILKPLFSIVLPVRNGGHLFKQCVQSILNQEYSYLKLHVLDNASSDGSLEWISEVPDERIVVYPSDRGLSIEENWKRILDLQTNEYVSLIGHDDILQPDFLSTMAAMIEQHQDASLFYANFEFINANGGVIKTAKEVASFLSPTVFVKEILNLHIDITGTGFVFKAKDYVDVGGIPGFSKLLFADYALWIALANKGNGTVVSTKKIFQFRIHENTSQKAATSSFCKALQEFMLFLSDFVEYSDDNFGTTVKENVPFFIEYYTKSLSNKMLRESISDRGGLTVKEFVKSVEISLRKLIGDQSYQFPRNMSLKTAIIIDDLPVIRAFYSKIRSFLLR